jgi:hypothetical protein
MMDCIAGEILRRPRSPAEHFAVQAKVGQFLTTNNMDKGIILLVKADDADSAKSEAMYFMNHCAVKYIKLIDWLKIGGRWQEVIMGNAQPYTKAKDTVKEWEAAQRNRDREVKQRFKKECKRQNIKTINDLLHGNLFELSYCLKVADNINRKIYCTDICIYDVTNNIASTEYVVKTAGEY